MPLNPESMITVTVGIGDESQKPINAYSIKLDTPVGRFAIGIDNNGNVYLSSETSALMLRPRSSNRTLIELED